MENRLQRGKLRKFVYFLCVFYIFFICFLFIRESDKRNKVYLPLLNFHPVPPFREGFGEGREPLPESRGGSGAAQPDGQKIYRKTLVFTSNPLTPKPF